MNKVRIHRKKLKTVLTQTGLLMEGLSANQTRFVIWFEMETDSKRSRAEPNGVYSFAAERQTEISV